MCSARRPNRSAMCSPTLPVASAAAGRDSCPETEACRLHSKGLRARHLEELAMTNAVASRNISFISHCDQGGRGDGVQVMVHRGYAYIGHGFKIGRASCRERVLG